MKKVRGNKVLMLLSIVLLCLASLRQPQVKAAASLTAPKLTGSYKKTKECESILTVTWPKVKGATGYEVYCRWSEPEAELIWGEWYQLENTKECKAKSSTIDGYVQIRVRAYKGNTYSKYSNIVTMLGGYGIKTLKEEKAETAESAYKKILKKDSLTYTDEYNVKRTMDINSYVMLDLNQDGTKELILSDYTVGHGSSDYYYFGLNYYVYTFKNGKAKGLGPVYDISFYDPQEDECKLVYNKKQKTLASIYHPFLGMGSIDYSSYQMKGSSISKKYFYSCYTDGMACKTTYYTLSGSSEKQIQKSTYEKAIKTYYNNKDIKYYTWKARN